MKFIQQAYKGNNRWWTYFVTLILLIFGWQFIGVIPLLLVAFLHSEDLIAFQNAAGSSFASLGIDSNLYLLLIIFTFLGGLIALLIGIKTVHRRKVMTVLTSREKLDWKRIFFAFTIWAAIGIIMIAMGYFLGPENFIWNFKPIPFTILCLISFFLLPIQTSMEEILFRGYLIQGFGILFRKGFIALILTSVIFQLLHGLNPEVEKLGMITMVYYIGTGLLLGIFTIMDEGMELALGFHAANNIIAAVFVTTNWTVFQTEALLIDTSEPSVDWEMFVPVFVLFPIVIFLFSYKYEWTDWKGKMFDTIRKPIELNEDRFIV